MYTQRFTEKKNWKWGEAPGLLHSHRDLVYVFPYPPISCDNLWSAECFPMVWINTSHTRQVGFLYSKSCPLAACHTIQYICTSYVCKRPRWLWQQEWAGLSVKDNASKFQDLEFSVNSAQVETIFSTLEILTHIITNQSRSLIIAIV